VVGGNNRCPIELQWIGTGRPGCLYRHQNSLGNNAVANRRRVNAVKTDQPTLLPSALLVNPQTEDVWHRVELQQRMVVPLLRAPAPARRAAHDAAAEQASIVYPCGNRAPTASQARTRAGLYGDGTQNADYGI
jgi:hypothetical protein